MHSSTERSLGCWPPRASDLCDQNIASRCAIFSHYPTKAMVQDHASAIVQDGQSFYLLDASKLTICSVYGIQEFNRQCKEILKTHWITFWSPFLQSTVSNVCPLFVHCFVLLCILLIQTYITLLAVVQPVQALRKDQKEAEGAAPAQDRCHFQQLDQEREICRGVARHTR